MRRGVLPAVVVTALFGLYLWAVVGKGIALVRTGDPFGVTMGLAALVAPLVCLGLIVREWQLAFTVQKMADLLAERGELPVDDLPRSPGGRIDRAAADAAFEVARARAEAEPDSWKAWYLLSFAYDAAGDRKRARAGLRKASALFRAAER
ncbi:hypothetical protein ATL41_0634 [Flavimobilis soli]|uniref:Tetratricopeptide repeat protein n=1 Tax=Flavimobilis soli TaxID=442709 RepID=A0A2A9EAN0_9MICO|nr:hypothetical protein [Flavimobilis soli]PFG35934.1 hypothetical protein ATL41_0634 [Flavimobilis soli]